MVSTSALVKPIISSISKSNEMFDAILNPEVTSSSVMGDTPVINNREMGVPLPVVPAFITLKNDLRNPSPRVIARYSSSPESDRIVLAKLSYSSIMMYICCFFDQQ